MESFSRLLFELYGGARDVPPGQFAAFALALVKSPLGFDSSRLSTVEVCGDKTVVHASILYNEPDAMELDWREISQQDVVMQQCIARPERALSFNAPDLYRGPSSAVMRDYAARYEHQNGLVCVSYGAVRGRWDGVCFYRASSERRYTERERRLAECLAPHLRSALQINRLLADAGMAAAPGGETTAISRADGQLQFALPAFHALMCLEWPEWRDARLPACVLAQLSHANGAVYAGRSITISANRIDTMLFLRASKRSPLACLTPRELTAARLFGSGLSNKEIARLMGISPNTVRNFVQSIYQKLDISDKAALAVIMHEHHVHAPLPDRAASLHHAGKQ